MMNPLCKPVSLPNKNSSPESTRMFPYDALACRHISARLENPTTTYPQTSPELGNFGANIQQDCSPRSTHSDGFGRTPPALRLKLRRSLRLWPRLVDIIIFVFKGRVIAIIPVAFLLFLFLVKGSAITVPVGPLFFRFRMLVIGSLIQDDGIVVAAFNSVSYLSYLVSLRDY